MADGAINEVLDLGAPSAHARVVKLVEAHHEGTHLRLRLRDGNPVLEPSDGIAAGVVTVVHSDGESEPVESKSGSFCIAELP